MFHRTTIFRDAETGAAAAQGDAAAGDLGAFLGAIAPEYRSVIETKGFHKDAPTPQAIVERMAKSYGELEKTVGLDKIALPPVGADGKPDWSKGDAVFKALGRPDTAEGYTAFKAPEGKAFSAEEKALHGEIGKLLHSAGVADWQANKIAAGLAQLQSGKEGQSAEQKDAETTATETKLRGEWGAAFDTKIAAANKYLAAAPEALRQKIIAAGLGRDPEFLAMAAAHGARMTEDPTSGNLPQGGAPNPGGPLTPAQAQEALTRFETENMKILTDKNHPEYKMANEKRARLANMAWPEPA